MGHRTVKGFYDALSKDDEDVAMGFVEIIKLICDCPEYKELPVRHNEDKLNAEFSRKCPIALDLRNQNYESPHTK